ncbi:MAG: FAD-dependent oxidoreductase [Terriglobales bacterium]
MARFRTQLIKRENPCDQTIAFHFAKPRGFEFRPGQYVDVALIEPPEMDSEGPVRTFSIASAPYEDGLLVATRMRTSTFKKFLATAPIGTEVQLEGPAGSFTLHKNQAKPAVFLAGGIGITPFRSILRQAAHDKDPRRLALFYGNSRPRRTAFLPDLEALAETNPRFQFVPLMAAADDGWKGPVGLIEPAVLKRYFPDLHGPIYYVAGPPEMVGGVRQALVSAGIDEDDIRSEEFGGY